MKLDGSTDASQISGFVESDSEAERELEMRLYSELYFEPNPDFVPLSAGSPGSCSVGKNGFLNQTAILSSSSTSPLENILNKAQTDLPVPVDEANTTSQTKATSQIETDLPEEISGVCPRLKDEKAPRPNIDDVANCEVLSPLEKIEVSTSAPGRYVFSLVNTSSSELDGSLVENSTVGTNTLSSTPINVLRSSRKNVSLDIVPRAKLGRNIESSCVRLDRKRIHSNINDELKICKRPKIDDDVISVSSGSLHDEPCFTVDKNSSMTGFLAELKEKVGVQKSPAKSSAKATKKRLASRQQTTYVAEDSSDSEESLQNDSMVCNFSLDIEGKDKTVSARDTSQNKRVDWPMDYASTRESKIRTPSIQHWTQHMTLFYDSDVSEEYEIDHLQRTMPDDMMEWEMEVDDFIDQPFRGRGKPRYFDQKQSRRCKRCRAYDHTLAQCRKLDYCHLCGDTTHHVREKCPRNCCFRCGREYHTFCPNTCPWNRCEVCHNKGHVKQICPDLWRRYAFTTSGTVPVHPGPRSSRSVRLPTCYSCGKSGHLGPDCAHRVQNYIVLHQEVHSYAPPARNCLGMTVLTEDLQDQPLEVDELYGETVQRYTAVRASVSLKSSQVGFIIGKKGNLINALRRLFGCDISILEDDSDPNSHLMWLKGARLDEALRCIMFLLNREADLTDVRDNMEKLDHLTGTKNFTQLWNRKMKEFRRTMHKMNEKKAKKEKKNSSANITVQRVDSDSESIVCVSDDECEKTRSHKNTSPDGRKFNLKRGRDEYLEGNSSQEDSEIEFEIKTGIALKKSKTIIDCEDSKYAAFDKLKAGSKNPQSSPTLLDLDNSSNSGKSDFEGYEDEDDDEATTDDEDEVLSSSEDSELVSDVSFDELNLASSIEDPNVFNLAISAASQAKLAAQRSKQFKALLQSLPMGRKSLIHAVNEKLAKVNAPINVENCLAKIRINCCAYRENKSDATLNTIRSCLEKLGVFVLGCKGLGVGKNLKKEIQRRTRALEHSSSRVVSVKDREALATVLAKLFHVDLSSMRYIIGLAEGFGEKENKPEGNTSVHSRLSFLNKSNNHQKKHVLNSSAHKQRSGKSRKNFKSCQSIDDIDNLDEQLASAVSRGSHFPGRITSTKKKFFRGKSACRSPKLQNPKASRSRDTSKVASSKKFFKDKFKAKNRHSSSRRASKSPNRKRR